MSNAHQQQQQQQRDRRHVCVSSWFIYSELKEPLRLCCWLNKDQVREEEKHPTASNNKEEPSPSLLLSFPSVLLVFTLHYPFFTPFSYPYLIPLFHLLFLFLFLHFFPSLLSFFLSPLLVFSLIPSLSFLSPYFISLICLLYFPCHLSSPSSSFSCLLTLSPLSFFPLLSFPLFLLPPLIHYFLSSLHLFAPSS